MERITLNPIWKDSVLVAKKEHQKYLLKDGSQVQGVTTILSSLNKPALLNWAAMEERKGILKCIENDMVIPEKYFFNTIKDTAADIGTIAHFISECFINQKNPCFIDYEKEFIEKGMLSFEKFRKFWENSGFKLIKSEAQLVSEKLKIGGTIDTIVTDQQNALVIIDLKTSKSIYRKEYGLQVAGYKILYEENFNTKIDVCILVRIGKHLPDDFETWVIDDIEIYESCFKTLVSLHHQLKLISK